MFTNINYDINVPLRDLKTHKQAFIILAVLSSLMLIAIIAIIVFEVTKNNVTTPKSFKSFAVVIVDDGNHDRIPTMTRLVRHFFKFDYKLIVAQTQNGIVQDVPNGTIVNVGQASNSLDVFFHFVQDGVPENVTNWIFLSDNVVPVQNVYAGDFFMKNVLRFVNLIQVDDVLFSTNEIPPSAPTMPMPNVPLPFVRTMLDLKIFMGTSTDFVYTPSTNQVVVLVDNDDLNERSISVERTALEKFKTYFIGRSVPVNDEKRHKLDDKITSLMG